MCSWLTHLSSLALLNLTSHSFLQDHIFIFNLNPNWDEWNYLLGCSYMPLGSQSHIWFQCMLQSHAKVKLLVRSHAMREETSPPPDPDAHHIPVSGPAPVQQQQQPQAGSINSLSVSRPNSRHKLRHQGSSQGSMDSSSPCLSRGLHLLWLLLSCLYTVLCLKCCLLYSTWIWN